MCGGGGVEGGGGERERRCSHCVRYDPAAQQQVLRIILRDLPLNVVKIVRQRRYDRGTCASPVPSGIGLAACNETAARVPRDLRSAAIHRFISITLCVKSIVSSGISIISTVALRSIMFRMKSIMFRAHLTKPGRSRELPPINSRQESPLASTRSAPSTAAVFGAGGTTGAGYLECKIIGHFSIQKASVSRGNSPLSLHFQ